MTLAKSSPFALLDFTLDHTSSYQSPISLMSANQVLANPKL